MATQGENAPLRCSGLLHAPLLIRRDGLGEASKISVWRKTTRDVKLVMSIDHQSLKSYFFPNDLLTHPFDGIAGIVGLP